MSHFKHSRAWCIVALMLAAGAAEAGNQWSNARGGQYRRMGQHSVVTVGNGSSPGSRIQSSKRRVQTMTKKSSRLTPERPLAGELRRYERMRRTDGVSGHWRQVESVTRNSSPRRNEVSSVSAKSSRSLHKVWTTQGEKGGR